MSSTMPNMEKARLTIMFVLLDGYGHLNSCVGVAEKLVEHGHRVIFALDSAWKGKAKRYAGFEEEIFVDPNRDPNLQANEHWIKFMDHFKKKFGLTPMEALKVDDEGLEKKFLDTMLDVDGEIKKIIDKVKPDGIVVDSYTTIPAVYKSNIPWIWLTSAQPLTCLPSNDLPPPHTDFPTDGDREVWKEYNDAMMEDMADVVIHFNKRMVDEFGLEPLLDGSLCHPSPYLNMYAYPKELDYLDIRPLPNDTWKAFDHFIRFTEIDPSFKLPEHFTSKPLGKLIYVSMGSMGCADTALMNRLIEILAKSPNRFVFSLGPRSDKLMPLPDNIWGDKFVPQVQLLPMVDMVITHGGNNTIIESLYYGKPVLVTPLFGDQFNNAQRVLERGFGNKINPYRCQPQEMLDMIEQLLSDETIKHNLQSISKRMQNSNSTEQAAIAIEQAITKQH